MPAAADLGVDVIAEMDRVAVLVFNSIHVEINIEHRFRAEVANSLTNYVIIIIIHLLVVRIYTPVSLLGALAFSTPPGMHETGDFIPKKRTECAIFQNNGM